MASNEIIPNTCGICEKIIEDSLIPTHECFEGYKELIIDNNNIYPVSDTAGIIRRAMEHDVEDIVYDEPSSHPNTDNYVALEESFIRPLSEMNENILLNNSSDSMELEELLIEKSEKREVLCNYGLLAQSNSAITAKPWDAISESLQDIKNMTLEDP
ncbi:hypothetical protein P5V15_008523 [Pogonomyrmex californicus]